MKKYNYIVIDDDSHSNLIVNIVLKKYLDPLEVKLFSNPESGLNYIMDEMKKEIIAAPFVLLLDINMPVISGWEVLEQIENLGDKAHQSLIVFMLSSSVDDRDMAKAKRSKFISDYLVKPLNKDLLISILDKLED